MRLFKEIILTAANPSVDMTNTAGSIEIGGTFGTATLAQHLTGGSTAIDTFTAAETLFTNASYLTWSITGEDGTTAVSVRWYYDAVDTDTVVTRPLRRVTNA